MTSARRRAERYRRLLLLMPALAVVLIAIAGPWAPVGSATASVGAPFQPGGWDRILGTDMLGRDVLARVLAGGRTLILQAIGATVLGSAVGLLIGVWAGMHRRRGTARAILRAVDGIAALPAILLLLLIAAGAPGNDALVAAAIAFVSLPFSVRINRQRTMQIAASDYARDAEARGDRFATRIWRDIMPGLLPVTLAEAGIRFVAAAQLAATAGFLGLGAGAPTANWGRMVRENSVGIAENPMPVLVPAALLIILTITVILALDKFGDAQVGSLERMGRPA